MTARGKRWFAALAASIAISGAIAAPYAATAVFLVDLAGIDSSARNLFGRPRTVTTRDLAVPTRHGEISARLYVPEGRKTPAVVVFPGIHGGGIDAPRLVRLCRRLSASGLTVVCAPLPDLRQFRITDRSTDMLEDITRWVADQPSIANREAVTLVGVSFAGGLALVAAGRPALHGRLNAVVSIGGHGDLTRTLRFMATGRLPDGSMRRPHDYGLAVVALTMADRLVPADQLAGFTENVRKFLDASLDDGANVELARRLMAELQTDIPQLPEPSRSLATAIAERDVETVGRSVLPFVTDFGNNPALSPALAPIPDAPVFLLHGADDVVIPSTEAALTAADLSKRGHSRVRWLLSPLLSHASLSADADVREFWRLVVFWRDVRRYAS